MAQQLFEITDGGEMRLRPHSYQVQAWKSLAQDIFVLKGWRGGFTSAAPFWLYNEMIRCGPGNGALFYLVVVPTLNSARGGLLPELERVFCTHLGLGKYIGSPKPRIEISMDGEQKLWGHTQRERTQIHFCYAEDPDSFASYTALAALGDEIGQKKFKYESWNVLNARRSTSISQVSKIDGRKMGRFLGGSTVYRLGWLEDVFNDYKRTVWQAFRCLPREEFRQKFYYGLIHPKMHFIRYDSTRNPVFPPEEMAAARRSLPKWFFDMRYRARFAKPAGAIFDGWDPARHVVDPFAMPARWPRTCVIDFGRKNFHALFIAHDEDRNRHFCYRSYRDAEHDNMARARQILEMEPQLSLTIAGQVSEDYDRAELAAGGLYAVPPAFKDMWLGISNVGAAIKLDRFFLFRGACPGLEDELRSYARPVNDQGEVDLDADPEDKDSFHWCFVAGTMVRTRRGDVPIERVGMTDYVLTREGYRPVGAIGNRHATNMRRVKFSDGRALLATADHPVWVEGKGFVGVDELRYCDTIKLIPPTEESACLTFRHCCQTVKCCCSRESLTTAIRTLSARLTGSTSAVATGIFTAPSGSTITERFRLAMRFTTATKTRPTMQSLIWNCRRSLITSITTTPRACAATSSARTWPGYAPRQRSGTAPQRGGVGIVSTPAQYGRDSSHAIMCVSSAPHLLSQPSLGTFAFAPVLARLRGAAPTASRTAGRPPARIVQPTSARASISRLDIAHSPVPVQRVTIAIASQARFFHRPWSALARCVTRAMSRGAAHRQSAAPVHVVSVCESHAARVYNLAVAEVPEFYANGILVSNCDAIRYYGTRKFSSLGGADKPAVRAGGKMKAAAAPNLVAGERARPSSVLVAGGGMTRAGVARMRRYGIDAGCQEPSLSEF